MKAHARMPQADTPGSAVFPATRLTVCAGRAGFVRRPSRPEAPMPPTLKVRRPGRSPRKAHAPRRRTGTLEREGGILQFCKRSPKDASRLAKKPHCLSQDP